MAAFSKHLINTAKSVVPDSLVGLSYLNPNTTFIEASNTLILSEPSTKRVHVICGGGSGHEPSHAAMVGEGILTAAVCGNVFASPNSRQVTAALERLADSKGVLIVVKQYTGDCIQFGLARERWNATHPGKESIKMVVVGDDVAVPRSQIALTGRRGLAATCLVYKIAGALAARGESLEDCAFLAQAVADRSGTIGVGLEHCHVPGTEDAEAYLKSDEGEIGMGIHNEPGNKKLSPIPPANTLVDMLLTTLTDTKDEERAYVDFKLDGKDEVVLLVNNLGGMSELEMGVLVKEATEWFGNKGISVERVLSGTYMTSLNLPGASFSVILLPREPIAVPATQTSKLKFDKDLILDCLDAPTDAPAWKWHYKGKPKSSVEKEVAKVKTGATSDIKGPKPTDGKLFLAALDAAMTSVIAAEPEITRYDVIAGDGDCGLTLKAGAEGVLAKLASSEISSDDAAAAMVTIGEVVEKEMGGTSGGLYSIFFNGFAKALVDAAAEQKSDAATAQVWARSLELALNTLYRYTRARSPSRTLVDPLSAFIGTLGADPSNFLAAFEAAKEATEATAVLEAKAGRAAYVDKDKISEANVPDAGAVGVLKLLEGIKSKIAA